MISTNARREEQHSELRSQQSNTMGLERHKSSVSRIASAIRQFYERREPFRINHGPTNSTRPIRRKNEVDISDLRNVLRVDPERFDLSQLIDATDFEALEAIRAGARDAAIEGVMLKRRDSPYVGGRRAGLWYKWKRDPLTADCVMMYAQRGSGRRSSYYSDYTFGCWTEDGELLPVGKAYQGITDEELRELDRFVRHNTTARFGPVREVEKTLVLEIAFDSIHASGRHKSGLAMRFPRIARIRSDKPAAEADTVAGLKRLVT